MLGIMDDFETDVESITMDPGDSLLMFTDGVTEAGIDFGEEFGETRVESVMRRLLGRPIAEMISGVARAAEEYSRGDHADDMTLLGMRALAIQ